jgi:hypothetical protein
MRWFWRADLLPLGLDGLLEGSLVGVGYMAVATIGSSSSPSAPLTLVEFWLAAAVGLAAARLRPGRLRRWFSVPALVVLAGAIGWLADPAARAALAGFRDPGEMLATHPAGWLLGVALFRGALHADTDRETDISTEAITYSFPLLGASLLLQLFTGNSFAVPALIGSGVCIVAGMLAIGYARMREFDSIGPTAGGGTIWPLISAGLVVVAVVAIPLAIFVGTAAQDPIIGAARSVAAAAVAIVASVVDWLQSILAHFLVATTSPQATAAPTATPATAQAQPFPPPTGAGGSAPMAWLFDLLFRAGVVAAVILGVLVLRRYFARRALRLGRQISARPREERFREQPSAAAHPSFRRPSLRSLLPWRRRPTTAVEAYAALLHELDDRGELARESTETPRDHARRAGRIGLEPVPLGLLAADYQLATYGGVPISENEDARAVGRWQRLRTQARRVSAREAQRKRNGA